MIHGVYEVVYSVMWVWYIDIYSM